MRSSWRWRVRTSAARFTRFLFQAQTGSWIGATPPTTLTSRYTLFNLMSRSWQLFPLRERGLLLGFSQWMTDPQPQVRPCRSDRTLSASPSRTLLKVGLLCALLWLIWPIRLQCVWLVGTHRSDLRSPGGALRRLLGRMQ